MGSGWKKNPKEIQSDGVRIAAVVLATIRKKTPYKDLFCDGGLTVRVVSISHADCLNGEALQQGWESGVN